MKKFIRRILLPITLLLGISVNLFCQEKPVRISGRVIDSESGRPLPGASVIVEGTRKGTVTDVEGQFFLTVNATGKFSIRFGNIGYTSKLVSELGGTETLPLDISLERNKNNQMEAVVVTSPTARKQSISGLYLAQKNSSSISDGIPAEIIRRSPDRNTGEVLKRVSGASIQDNKFVVIRGLSERYNVSIMNNSVLPSTEPDKKAFSFDIIPSSVIDNLVIFKSPTPDLPGDFSGGAIKISTRDFPSRKTNELQVTLGFNSLTTFKDFYKGFPTGKYDWLGYFDNSRDMPSSYYKYRGAEFINQPDHYKRETTKQFPNTFGYEPDYKSGPTVALLFSGGNTLLLKNNRKLGYNYSIGYASGKRVANRDREEYTFDKILQYDYLTNNYDYRNNLSALLNFSYSYGHSKISFKNFYNNSFIKTAGIRNGSNFSNQPDTFYYKSTLSEATSNGIYNSVLEGLHNLNHRWVIDWNGSFGVTYRWQPDQRILSFRTPDNDHGDYYLRLSNENSPGIENAGRVYSYLTEYIYGANLNLTKTFSWLGRSQVFKIGSANYYRDRNVEVDALGYSSLNFTGVTIPETKNTTFNNIFSPENIDLYNLTVANIGTNSTDYTGTAMLNAGYLMFDNSFSDKLKLTWGIRAENYDQQIKAQNKQNISLNNLDFLPSFLVTYGLNKKTNLRLGASQTVNRPEFRELASYSVFDYDNYNNIIGNPNLQRAKNTNADLRYEWFPDGGEIVSASVFYKYFENPIEQVNQGNNVLTYQNANSATSYGAEIEFRKRLNFFGGDFFQNLTLYANAALIKGSVKFGDLTYNSPLQGQSPYLINGGLSYISSHDDFSVNILYNRIGPRLRYRAVNGAAMSIYEMPRDLLDFQVSKKILANKLEIKLTVGDILAQAFTLYYKFEPNPSNTEYNPSQDKIINTVNYGTTTTIALRYLF